MGDTSATGAHHPQIQQPSFAAVSGADQEPTAPFDGAVSSRVWRGCKEKNATILSTSRSHSHGVDLSSRQAQNPCVGTSQTPGFPKMPGIQALLDLIARDAQKESLPWHPKTQISTFSAAELARTLGSARHPLVVDVRRQAAFSASQHLICGSLLSTARTGATVRDCPPSGQSSSPACTARMWQTAARSCAPPGSSRISPAASNRRGIRICARPRPMTAPARRPGAPRGRDRPHRLPLAIVAPARSLGADLRR